MKKFFLLLLAMMALCSTTATADVVFDETNFPDPGFRDMVRHAYYEEGIDINEGDILTDELLETPIFMEYNGYIPHEFKIHSVEGIQYLKGLLSFDFPANYVDSIDLSQNTNITYIYINPENPLNYLNICGLSHLRTLYVPAYNLDELNMTGCNNIRDLTLSGINNEDLIIWPQSVEQLQQLNYEDCEFITESDISHLKYLKQVKYQNCPNLAEITFFRPDPLDMSQTGLGLQGLWIQNTAITEIDVSNYFSLEGLSVYENPYLERINASNCPLLNEFYSSYLVIRDNELLESIDLSDCSSLHKVWIYGNNNLTNVNMENCEDLRQLQLYDVYSALNLNLTDCSSLETLFFYRTKLNRIVGVESIYNSLQDLRFDSNGITSIGSMVDISSCPNLNYLLCENNKVNAVDLTNVNLSSCVFDDDYHNQMNGRRIQVYQTVIDGVKQFYIPIATTDAHKGIKDLIEQENNYENEDTGFDWANVVTESITGATLGELDGEQVLWLDVTTTGASEGLHRMTYQYLTHSPNEAFATAEFYLDWAEAATMRGDVNGDDEVDINDVTLLIDAILGKSVEYNATAADCNTASGDGSIDINDVTALINYVLAGNW